MTILKIKKSGESFLISHFSFSAAPFLQTPAKRETRKREIEKLKE
jgi:hypothetical protein